MVLIMHDYLISGAIEIDILAVQKMRILIVGVWRFAYGYKNRVFLS